MKKSQIIKLKYNNENDTQKFQFSQNAKINLF